MRQTARQRTVTRHRQETRYRNETRTRTRTRTRRTDWSTFRSGTFNAQTESASRSGAQSAANAVNVGEPGRPNSRATIQIERNVNDPVNTQTEQTQPAGTINVTNISLSQQLLLGSSGAGD